MTDPNFPRNLPPPLPPAMPGQAMPGQYAPGQPMPPGVLPYQTPGTSSTGVVCPKCQYLQFKRVSFTWWGGALGPRLFNHVKCLNCGAGFNSKTGKSNDTAIIIYTVVGFIVGLMALVFWIYARTG